MTPDCERFKFAFMRRYRLPLSLLGIGPRTAWVVVECDGLTIQFGLWRLRTSIDNVRDARRTGPYRGWRAIGPRVSLADRGVTFGTTSAAGVCIQFASAVPALLPAKWPRHPAATVTVAEPDRLVALLTRAVARHAPHRGTPSTA
jgi:hypothetical protein